MNNLRNRFLNIVWSILLSGPVLIGQTTDSLQLHQSLPVMASLAAADNLDQVYVMTLQNNLEKYAADGSLLARFSNNRLGTAAALDVSNPLNILVWYPSFRTIIFLGRSLTPAGELNLVDAGFPEVRTVAMARDGNLWLYDETQFRLRKISPEGAVLFSSQDLNLVQHERLDIHCLADDGSAVYASDPGNGILVFDAYGQFQRILPWKGVRHFSIEQQHLNFIEGNSVHSKQPRGWGGRHFLLPENARNGQLPRWLSGNHLLVQDGPLLQVYHF
jgi:hypothetical protein